MGLPMPNCTEKSGTKRIEFGRLGRRAVEGRFDGSMTSDGGVMLLSEVDRKIGLMQAASRCITDPRSPLLIKHCVRDMLRQAVSTTASYHFPILFCLPPCDTAPSFKRDG